MKIYKIHFWKYFIRNPFLILLMAPLLIETRDNWFAIVLVLIMTLFPLLTIKLLIRHYFYDKNTVICIDESKQLIMYRKGQISIEFYFNEIEKIIFPNRPPVLPVCFPITLKNGKTIHISTLVLPKLPKEFNKWIADVTKPFFHSEKPFLFISNYKYL